MISYVKFICILVTVTAELRPRDPDAYAENKRHFPRQRLSAMTNLTETIYVLMRDYDLETPFDCLSAIKVKNYSENEYQYTLMARNKTKFISYNVNMTARITGNHSEPNSAYYEEVLGEGKMDHKLMTTNRHQNCFVFAVNRSSKGFGCIFAVTEDAADVRHPPRHCEYVYRKHCGNPSIVLYKDDCKRAAKQYRQSHRDHSSQ
uniref:Putative lipocalin n=1 Tax=Rhipicephalus microplus TaxID=6941 RepID=A0A6G5A5T7_RHIMP